MKFIRIFLGLFIVSAIFFTACSHPDTTKVTVYFAKNGQASLEQKKLPLIDRFLNLFSDKAYAQLHDPANTDYYFLWITADDIDGIYTPLIPGTQTSISIDVPSGTNRVFTILSFHGSYYNYLGQTVANLSGGNASVSVNMYPCVNDINIPDVLGGGDIQISWTYDPTLISETFTTLKIYRACFGDDPTCDGTISTVTLSASLAGSPFNDPISSITSPNPQIFYYFLSIDTGSFGGGGLPVPTNFIDFFSTNYFISIYMMGSCQYIYNP